MVRANSDGWHSRCRTVPEATLTGSEKPDKSISKPDGSKGENHLNDRDLDARTKALETALSGKIKNRKGNQEEKPSTSAGYAQAVRLSSEFIAGIALGVFIGWVIDELAGTSPWGLIVFLFLGFCAGVLNVMRSAGLVAENEIRLRKNDREKGDRE